MTAHDISTLKNRKWVNDEVINFYMTSLQERNLELILNNAKHPRLLLLKTYFYGKLSEKSYSYNNSTTNR